MPSLSTHFPPQFGAVLVSSKNAKSLKEPSHAAYIYQGLLHGHVYQFGFPQEEDTFMQLLNEKEVPFEIISDEKLKLCASTLFLHKAKLFFKALENLKD